MVEFWNRHKVLLLHISFWLLYFSYRVYDISEYLGLRKALLYVSIPMTFNIAASYVHYFFVLPKWIRSRRIGYYTFQILLLITCIVAARILIENQIFAGLFSNENYFKTVKVSRVISTVWETMTFMLFTGMIRFTLERFDLENKRKQLENEKLVAELNYLKAQINPHFLFNTLHNLNYLVYAGSKKSTEVIIKLSNIMRYMIYDANREKVSLKKELDYMHDYIDLESIRLNKAFDLSFDIKGDVHDKEIAPLILITFLENAFKHGVSDRMNDCWVKLKIEASANGILFSVSNKKINLPSSRTLKSGFGLENVKKRLQLSYPERHSLHIMDDQEAFNVNLTITVQ